MTIYPPLLAQTTASTLNEIATALQQFSAVGAGGMIAGVLIFVYMIMRQGGKREAQQAKIFGDLIGGSLQEIREGFQALNASVQRQNEETERQVVAITSYAERQMILSQESAKMNKNYHITYAETRGALGELTKAINLQAESMRLLHDNTRHQIELIDIQSKQNGGTLELVKAFANELQRHEKAAITRSEQIHTDFQQMRKDRSEHLDEMTKAINRLHEKLNALLDSNKALTDAVTILVKNGTPPPPDDASAEAA